MTILLSGELLSQAPTSIGFSPGLHLEWGIGGEGNSSGHRGLQSSSVFPSYVTFSNLLSSAFVFGIGK